MTLAEIWELMVLGANTSREMYFQWWLTYYALILATGLTYYLVFAFEYRLNGGSDSIWKGLLKDVQFYLPGGVEKRIALLDSEFWDREEVIETGMSSCCIFGCSYNWDTLDYVKAIYMDDHETLRKMTKMYGSGWYFWLGRTVVALILALVLPMIIAILLFALIVSPLFYAWDKVFGTRILA